jgi:reactive intermediate/imine deaminase
MFVKLLAVLPFALLAASPVQAQQAAPLPFSPAVRAGDTLYLSGQIGVVPEGMDRHGAGFDAAAKGAMDKIGEILARNGAGFDKVVKCTVMLADMADWPRFNAVYVGYFKDKALPARSAFGASGLAMNAAIEVECIATFDR